MSAQHSTPELEPYLVLAQEIMRRVYADVDGHTLNQWILHQLGRLGSAAGDEAFIPWLEALIQYDEIINDIRNRAELPADQRRELVWPWASWNAFLDPLEPGMLAVLAGADGSGKTIYAESLAEHWAKTGAQVLFVHFELNKRVMWHRRASRHTSLDYRTLRQGALGFDNELHDARQTLERYPGGVHYLPTPGWTMERVIQEASRRHNEGVCDVVVIDYLEKAAASEKQVKLYRDVWLREADTVEMIKTWSESASTPVFMLSQFNKEGKGTGKDNLDRTAIRGAGEKTEKANVVILLHRDKLDNGEYSSTVDVRFDKNTTGRTGNAKQFMDAAHFRVGDFVRK
mgnify:FL=1